MALGQMHPSSYWFTRPSFLRAQRKTSGPVHISHLPSTGTATALKISSSVKKNDENATLESPEMYPLAIQVSEQDDDDDDDTGLLLPSKPSTSSSLVLAITCGSSNSSVIDLIEVLGFIGWFFAFLLILFLGVLVWVVFFNFVVRPVETSERMKWTGIWISLALSTFYFRHVVRKTISPMMKSVLDHAEIFIATSLVMVFGANTAFYMHTASSEPLHDLGFALLPEQALDSSWRSLSDIMTVALPIICAFQSTLMSRPNRCAVFCSFFRLMTICYGLRTLTVPLTSLPGPAPHCRPNSTDYNPPENWIDIVTRVGPMHGKFNTCGDLLFSGHMCYINSALLLYLRQLDLKFPNYSKLRWGCGFIYLVTVAVLCIAGRKHYTVDIVLGIIISVLVFFHFEHGWVPPSVSQTAPPKNYPWERKEESVFFRDCTCLCSSSTASILDQPPSPPTRCCHCDCHDQKILDTKSSLPRDFVC